MSARLSLLVVLLAALLLAPNVAAAATPKTTLPDVEDEVMCVECGTVLNISTSQVADDQREFIQARIDRGQSKDEIKAALVEEFGPDVLAMPDRRGFNLAVYALELAQAFTAFYRDCKVIGAEPVEVETARIRLCVAVRATIARALELLGVSAPESM